jgi:adenylosuccinate lyase
MKAWEEGANFKELILNDTEIMNVISKEDFDEVFSYDRYIQNVDFILRRSGVLKD